jgi:hypothetical protein
MRFQKRELLRILSFAIGSSVGASVPATPGGLVVLCGVNLAARHGDQFGIRRFVYRIGDEAGDHSSSNDAEPKLRVVHRFSF